MRKESFTRAKSQIESFFFDYPQHAYTLNDLHTIFENNKEPWRIANYRRVDDFGNFLEKENILKLKKLVGTSNSNKRIWVKNTANNYDIGLTIKKDGYIAYYSAMQYHQLTLQIPKVLYISVDKYGSTILNSKPTLKQESVDKAFEKKQRVTSEVYTENVSNFKYSFTYKKHNSINIGVAKFDRYKITDIERTLIDIAIRPAYSGGVFEVLEAYNLAKEKIDIIKLEKYLTKLDYIYPYHQLIGFYLEKAGYDIERLKIFEKKISKIKFYLTYNLSVKILDEKWNIYYPMGF